MIINLTQHTATDAQLAAGVVEPTPELKAAIVEKLNFDTLPSSAEITAAAASLAWLADESGEAVAMIGGAPFLMSPLEEALTLIGIRPLYAYSRRESVEQALPDGSVSKVTMFRHVGFVSAPAWERRDEIATKHHDAVTGLPADCDPADYGLGL